MKTGDRVRITHAGKTLDAVVLLASPNGRSVMFEFDGMLGGYRGTLPALEEDGVFRDLINGDVVDVGEP